MKGRRAIVGAGVVVIGLISNACGSSDDGLFANTGGTGGLGSDGGGSAGTTQDASVGGSSGQGGTATGGAGGKGGVGGVSGTGGSAGGTGGQAGLGGSAGTGQGGGAGACAEQTFSAQPLPLDVYVLLDATASMSGANGTPIVWPSVTTALLNVIGDPKSDGIAMGLTFLPVAPAPGFKMPGSCTTNADCTGSTGPCEEIAPGLPKTCTNACTDATVQKDCGLYGPCIAFLEEHVCSGAMTPTVSCDPAEYGKPVVQIAALPGNKDALTQAISTKDPNGDATPTEPSLRGTLTYASQWAASHAGHLVNVLFATDGLPNDCTTNSVAGAADAAKTAFQTQPSIRTFVLGLGGLNDLNQIAAAGGTTQAYLADSATVGKALVDVFNEIRAQGTCQYQIPQPNPPAVLDFTKVNISYTPAGGTPVVVKYVGDVSNCDPTQGGWYYDKAPSVQDPSMILLCPATCQSAKASTDGVHVLVGCQTVGS